MDVVTFGETMVLFAAVEQGPLRFANTYTRHSAGTETNFAIGLARLGHQVGWFSRVGDDEFGRPAHFRAWRRRERPRYVLDVPGDTVARDLQCRRPRRRAGRGARRQVPSCRVDTWAARQPESRWTRLTVRDGERGPLSVDAMTVRVRTKLDRRLGPEERLVVMRTVEVDGARGPLRAEQRRAAGPAGGAGAGPVHEAQDRGGVRGGQAGGGPGARRGEVVGGSAPPHDAVPVGPMVPGRRAAADRGGKPRR